MYIGLLVKYPLFMSDFNENTQISNFYENPSSGRRVIPCGQTDRQTDMTKLIVALRSFANAPENVTSRLQCAHPDFTN